MIWGWSLSISLSGCNPDKIRNGEWIATTFEETVKEIGMTPYGKTAMVHFGKDPKVTGWSANIFLEESNMTGHFVEGDNSAHIDIFSCKTFDSVKLLQTLKEKFEAQGSSAVLLERGQKINVVVTFG